MKPLTKDQDPTGADEVFEQPADDAPLTPEERARLLAELEAEFEAAERSIEEEGVVTPEELKEHMDALFESWAREEEERSAQRRP